MARSFHKVTPAARPGGVRKVPPRRRRETEAALAKGDRGTAQWLSTAEQNGASAVPLALASLRTPSRHWFSLKKAI